MTTPKSPSEKLKAIRDEQARKKAEFDAEQLKLIEALRLENEAAIFSEEAVAKAAAEEFDKAEKVAETAFKEAEAKKKVVQKLTDQHLKLFGRKPSSKYKDSDDTDEGLAPSLKDWVSKIWGWMVFLLPKVFKVLLLAVIAWFLVWGYFGIANFMGNADASVGYDAGAISDPESTVVPTTSIPEPTALSESVVEQTAVPEPTAEPTAIANSNPKPIKPMEQKPKPVAKPTSVPVAPAIPITWNSGPTGSYKPMAGMICHGDMVGPFGSSDGTRPVIVQFWSNQPEPLNMVWVSCEVNTGRNLNQIKAEIEAKYGKTFEVVNN